MRRPIAYTTIAILTMTLGVIRGARGAELGLREAEPASREQTPAAMHDVMLVGNSVSGTVTVLDGRTFASLATIDVIPDIKQRLDEINSFWHFWRRIAYKAIKKAETIKLFEPAGGDRFIDDLFLSPDGATLYVSRGNLGDVAAFDLTKAGLPMRWRTTVKGHKADHATISRDGSRIVVSASAAGRAHVIRTSDGKKIGDFKTGVLPHQNDYSDNGKHIYNGSLGLLDLPFKLRHLKGRRDLIVVDADTLKVVRTYSFEDGVRPTVIADDEKTAYLQLSYLNGLVKFDLVNGSIVKRLDEPKSAFATKTYATEDDYPHNSAHHGLALSGDGRTLCDCGTIDNSVSLVSADDLTVKTTMEEIGMIPYWATTSPDGNHCVVSLSGDNAVVVIDYRTGKEVARVPVGKFPQRNRAGLIAESALRTIAATKP
jgi:YVTN family beta-propeller protein